MDNEAETEYRALVRGAATWVLVGKKNPATAALELAWQHLCNIFRLN